MRAYRYLVLLLVSILSVNVMAQSTEEIEAENQKRSNVEHGILTLTNGETIEGRFKAEFRQTPEGKLLSSGKLELTFTIGGPYVGYYYTDKKGKTKTRYYKAKDFTSFRILNQGTEDEVYVNLTYSEESVDPKQEQESTEEVVFDLGGSFDFLKGSGKEKEKTKLVYVAADKSKSTLYTFDKDLFITDKRTNESFRLYKDELADRLRAIAHDCPSLLSKIEAGAFEYSLESLTAFVNQLEDCDAK